MAGFFFRQSDQHVRNAKDPKSKMGGDCCSRCHPRDCGAMAGAQQPTKISRIGILLPTSASVHSARIAALRQRLRELGYVEGKNIVIEYRYADGKLERVSDLAAELVRLKVDVIVTTGPGISAAKKASATMPIVFAGASDPVGTGYVSSLARPGGNITGLSIMAPDLDGKRLELLKEAFPKVARVAFLWEPGGPRGNLTQDGGCGQGVATQTSIA